jgi:hypothetical protein
MYWKKEDVCMMGQDIPIALFLFRTIQVGFPAYKSLNLLENYLKNG